MTNAWTKSSQVRSISAITRKDTSISSFVCLEPLDHRVGRLESVLCDPTCVRVGGDAKGGPHEPEARDRHRVAEDVANEELAEIAREVRRVREAVPEHERAEQDADAGRHAGADARHARPA